jgi:tetratricopeptide (TPR) repeat protein
VEVLKKKAERNLRLLHERLMENPDDAYACYQIGNTASMFQRYDEAKSYLRRALKPGGLSDSLRALVLNLLGEAELRTGRPRAAEECCRASLGLAPVQLTARWYIVGAKIEMRDFPGAVEVLREIIAMFFEVSDPPAIGVSVDIQMEEWRVRQITGQCVWKTGDGASALRCFADALRLNPSSREVRANFETALRAAGAPAR